MYYKMKYPTLNELIAELQAIAEQKPKESFLDFTYGEMVVMSIGSSCGKIDGKDSPYCFRLKDFETDADKTVYANSMTMVKMEVN